MSDPSEPLPETDHTFYTRSTSEVCRKIFQAGLRAILVFSIEAIVHALLHGLEAVTGEPFDPKVYAVTTNTGIGAFFLYILAGLLVHANQTIVETRNEIVEAWEPEMSSLKQKSATGLSNVQKSDTMSLDVTRIVDETQIEE